MKRSVFKFLAILVMICLYQPNAHAQKNLVGTKELPLELNLLIESYQAQSPDNYSKILPIVMDIDLYARSLTKEDIFLIGKIEVYKTLLKNYDTPIKQPVDGTTLVTLKAALSKTNDNFTKWFVQALLKDSQELIANPLYKEFLLQKRNNIKLEKVEYRKLEKKGELIQFWVSKLSPETPDFAETIKADLAPKMLESLKNIQSSFSLIAKEGTLGTVGLPLKNESELKYFTISDVAPTKPLPVASETKSVEDILSPITDPAPTDLPKPSQENWLEDENTPPSLQNLPKPSNDADWLQDF